MVTVRYYQFDPDKEDNRDAPILEKKFKTYEEARAFARFCYEATGDTEETWLALHADSSGLLEGRL